ncbi:receptor protein kinase-like protein ZAR1 [Pyrus x bretschneideri]|uniref:receptor protein kinase-like protein ZAR1 n=1 Tax=Pyrus x bretschneideri TaxID=225117 RepID=UPI00202F7843|nr:receptor protein kinase-like protein ZAR1 [Pyrus x bretschneideri]
MIIERVGEVAYRLELPSELARVHNVFHMSMLRHYVADPSHVIPPQPLEINPDLTYDVEPVMILDWKKKVLRNKTSSADSPNSGLGSENSPVKGLSPGLIILISVADAAGLVVVYIYWKKKDDENGCSCTGKSKFGSNEKRHLCNLWHLCSCTCINGGFGNQDSDSGDPEKAERGKGEGDLVAIDKGFTFELDELLRASAYVLGKSGLGIVYKVVLGNGIPVAVRRLGEGGDQRYKEFAAEIQVIGRVKHPNVVNLRKGWSVGEIEIEH